MNNVTFNNSLHQDSDNNGNFTRLIFCIYLPIAALILLGNGLIIAAFFKCPHLRSSTNRYLTSMAIGDIIYGLSRMLWLATLFPSAVAYNRPFCVVSGTLLIVTRYLSLSHIFIVILNRTVAIMTPFHHPNLCGPRNTTFIVIFIWLVSYSSSIPGFYALWSSWNNSTVGWKFEVPIPYVLIDICLRLVLVCVIIITSIILLAESLKVARRIDDEKKVLDSIALRVQTSKNQNFSSVQPESESAQKRITRSLLAIVAIFVFCNLTPLITELLGHLVPSFSAKISLLVFLNVGPSITAVINPWVFTLKDRRMYAVVIDMLACQSSEGTV